MRAAHTLTIGRLIDRARFSAARAEFAVPWPFFSLFRHQGSALPAHNGYQAHVEAPTAGSVFLAGLMATMGTYDGPASACRFFPRVGCPSRT